VPQSFLRFPAQSGSKDKPVVATWQEVYESSLVESCARLCKSGTLVGRSKYRLSGSKAAGLPLRRLPEKLEHRS
jgi:hypothetical protein